MMHDTPDRPPILTIGYGSRSMEDFISTLQRYGVHYVIDIRSAPYSRYKPEFSKDGLDSALDMAGIRYVYMGDALGGRPDDTDCYDAEGKVDYESVKTKSFYQAGLERIATAFEQRNHVVLMCSEGKPQDCHRSKLIGVSLDEAAIPVEHIDENGDLKSQEEVMVIVRPQPSLFEEFDSLTSRKKYPSSGSAQDLPYEDDNAWQ